MNFVNFQAMDEFSTTWKYFQYIWPGATPLWSQEWNEDSLERLKRSTADAGTLCILARRKDEKSLREFIMGTTFSVSSCYALVPGYSAPRWIIPLGDRRAASASLRLYNPQSLKGKLLKHIVRHLAYFGIQSTWASDRLLLASRVRRDSQSTNNGKAQNASLIEFLQDMLDTRDAYFAFSTGTPGYYRKTTVQVMSRESRPIAYAKIAYTQQAQKLLMQEARILRRLAGMCLSKGHVPRLLYAGQFHKNELIVQSASPEETRSGPRQLDIRHIEFLAEIFNQTSVPKPFSESEYWSRLKNDVDSLRDRVSGDWHRRLKDGLDICGSVLANKVMSLGLCHRDFAPWNTYLERGRLYVFDWEYATEQGIPFWDIFHFAFYPKIIVSHWSGKQLINYWKHRKLRRLLTQYAQNTGVDVTLIPVCFLLYFIEVSCFYLDMFTRDGLWNAQRQYSERAYAEVLDELTMHWKGYDNWE